MGVAIVGPPSSGKSTLRNLLYHVSYFLLSFLPIYFVNTSFQALSRTDRVLKQHIFNPKSMPRNQLLGQIDLDTRQWNDGVLTICSLQATAESLGRHRKI